MTSLFVLKNLKRVMQVGLIGYLFVSSVSMADEVKPALQSLAELSQKAPEARHLKVEEWQTKEGSKVLFVRAPELAMFDLRLTFAAGSSQDGDKPGIALLTNGMLNEGVPDRDVESIANGFDKEGASFSNGSYRDMAVVSLRSLTEPSKYQPALALFCQVIGQPTFPESSLERISNQLLTGFEIQKKTPSSLLNNEFNRLIYGQHPYAHPTDGNESSIKSITVADLKAFYQRAYNAHNVVIALVGDLSTEQAKAIAEQVSAVLPKGKALTVPALVAQSKPQTAHLEFPSQQTHIVLGQLAVTRDDPDYPALYLGNQILGGSSLSSRLMVEVRERRGLTYGVYSGFSPMKAAGDFSITLQTRAEMSEGTLALIKQLVAQYLQEGPTPKELEEAKKEIAGSFPLSNASNSDIVAQLGAIGFYNLPTDYLQDFVSKIQGVTLEQVKEAMAKHLSVDQFTVVTVGPTVTQKPLPAPTDKVLELRVPEH